LKYSNGKMEAWRVEFLGRKRPQTLLSVFFIAIHLVE
jgi:hypothetical protein